MVILWGAVIGDKHSVLITAPLPARLGHLVAGSLVRPEV